MLRRFNQRRIRIRIGTALFALMTSLWFAMAVQPCFAENASFSSDSAKPTVMADCHDAAAVFSCNELAELECELPDRGPFATTTLALPLLAPALIYTLDIALILAPASVIISAPSMEQCTSASVPPLHLQNCVFLI